MRIPVEYQIEEIVPHAGRMSLLTRAIAGNAESIITEVDISEQSIFFSEQGIGGWVGIEFMAQTVAAWSGWQARLRGQHPSIGFLLGTRRYQCSLPYFLPGQTLSVEAVQIVRGENGLAQFDCKIVYQDTVVASAALTVYEPGDSFGTDEKNNE